MADNYLERKMEEYRSGKVAAPRRRLIPSGAGRPQVSVPLGDVTVLVVGVDEPLVAAFANAGARVRFCNAADEPASAGRRLAERCGAQYYPYREAEARGRLAGTPDYVVSRDGNGDIILHSAANGITRRLSVGLLAGSGDNAEAAAAALAVLFCTPLFASAAATVVES